MIKCKDTSLIKFERKNEFLIGIFVAKQKPCYKRNSAIIYVALQILDGVIEYWICMRGYHFLLFSFFAHAAIFCVISLPVDKEFIFYIYYRTRGDMTVHYHLMNV